MRAPVFFLQHLTHVNGEAITAKDRAQGTALFGIVKQMREQANSSITNGARLAKSLEQRSSRSSERSSNRKQSLSDLYEEGRGSGGKSSLWSGVKSQVGKQDSNLAHYRHERVAAQCIEDVIGHSMQVEQKIEKLEELWPSIVRNLVKVRREMPGLLCSRCSDPRRSCFSSCRTV